MRLLLGVFAVGSMLVCLGAAQEAPKPELRQGVSVQMPVAKHAVEMRAADEANSTVVAITAEGKVYAGIKVTEVGELSSLRAQTVYVKADSRVPFQTVLAVLDALRGKSVVLLAASPAGVERGKYVAPYGIKVVVAE